MNVMDTKTKIYKMILSSFISGLGMWFVGGLYHNLIMPAVHESVHPHHEGLGITFLAYLLLGFLMSYFYNNSKDTNSVYKGVKIGAIVGVLWVFPHGLTMAAVHKSEISYQFTNTLYHILEQGIGGMLIYAIFKYKYSVKRKSLSS